MASSYSIRDLYKSATSWNLSSSKCLKRYPMEMLSTKFEDDKTALHLSVCHNNFAFVSAILKAGVQVDCVDESKNTPLHIAIRKGYVKCVKLLLAHGAVWQRKDKHGLTALHIAACQENINCLNETLTKVNPAEIDVQDNMLRTPLHYSAAFGYCSHIKSLLNAGSHIGIPDITGKTPIHWAVMGNSKGSLFCLKELLAVERLGINWQDYNGHSALHFAVLGNNIPIIEFLTAEVTSNVNIMDHKFSTPLHLAARFGDPDMISLLLDRGSTLLCLDAYGAAPLHYAAYADKAENVKQFLSHGFMKDIPDSNGRTAVMWAASQGATKAIDVLKKWPVDLHWQDKNGSTALHIAVMSRQPQAVVTLLELGATVDAYDYMGETPLMKACKINYTSMARLLIKWNAKLDAKSISGSTPLHYAAKCGKATMCDILICSEANIDSCDKFGSTPTVVAAMNNHNSCVLALISHNPDLRIYDNERKAPLHWVVLKCNVKYFATICNSSVNLNPVAQVNGRCVTPLNVAIDLGKTAIVEYLLSAGAQLICQCLNTNCIRNLKWWAETDTVQRKLGLENNTQLSLDEAACIIQRSYRRFAFKKNMHRMRT